MSPSRLGGMLAEHLRRANRQRRIEEDRRRRHLAALHQVDEIDDQFLRALDGEGRDQQRALARGGVANLGGEPLAPLLGRRRRAVDVAIGRIRRSRSRIRRRLRIGLQQLGVGTDVAGGEHAQRLCRLAFAGEFDLDRGRAEQMPGVPVARAHAGHDLDPGFVIDRPEGIERCDGIGLGVDRTDLRRARARRCGG